MLIPINTDAPLYHFPYATIFLIFANFVCFVATGFATNERLLEPWLLEYGNNLNPLEWIPAAFAHGGFGHLIGNMFFLWGFGLVVEGKLGWRVFIPLYFAMAAGWGAAVDVLTLHRTDNYVASEVGCKDAADFHRKFAARDPELINNLIDNGVYLPFMFEIDEEDLEEGDDEFPMDGEFGEVAGAQGSLQRPGHAIQMMHVAGFQEVPGRGAEPQQSAEAMHVLSLLKGRCLGASGVIFALMAIALVWAPKNEMHIVGFIGYRPVSFDVTIMTYSLWYLALNIIELLIMKFQMGSSGLHMVGAILGFGVGVVFLKRNWVDCEKWDLFAVLSGKYGRFADDNWALGAHGNVAKVYGELPVPEDEEGGGRRRKGTKGPLAQVNQLIDEGDFLTASEELFNLRLDDSTLFPAAERAKKLIMGLLQAQGFDEAEGLLEDYIERYPDQNSWARIRLAQLLLKERQRPRAALQALKGLSLEGLSDQLKALAKKIAAGAKEQVRSGVQDAEPEW